MIQAPLDLIHYVIVHELRYLAEHRRSKRYYVLPDTAMLDWRRSRQRLDAGEVRVTRVQTCCWRPASRA
jgi:predicted metal-dependent hydrolase